MNGSKGKLFLISALLLFSVLFYLSFYLISRRIVFIRFLDDINLLIHEAGHLIFRPFGKTLRILGGTIAQVSIPVLFLIYFLKRSDRLGVSFSIFWVGEVFINVSYYISDAQDRALPLIGGGSHDWYTLLSSWNMIHLSQALGKGVFYLGSVIMVFSLVSILLFIFKEFDINAQRTR
jgi:hypothetical protein